MDNREEKKNNLLRNCYNRYEGCLEFLFERTGRFISNYPVIIMIFCIIMNCGLIILTFFSLENEKDMEVLYSPHDSQSFKDRAYLKNMYGDPTVEHFQPYQLPEFGKYAEVIVMSRNRTNIKSNVFFKEIREIDKFIKTSVLVKDYNGSSRYFKDLCAILSGLECVVSGNVILTQSFEKDFISNNVTLPMYNGTFLSPILANSESHNGVLVSTTGVKIRYHLLQSNVLSSEWEENFLLRITDIKLNETEIAYSTSESLERELDKNTNGDIHLFAVTFTLMLTYASLASASSFLSCNNIANRVMLGFAGVLTPVLAIGSAIGFVSAIGVKFTSIVGVMPFLVVGNFLTSLPSFIHSLGKR